MGWLAKVRRGRDLLAGEYAQGVMLRVMEEQKWFVLVFEHRGLVLRILRWYSRICGIFRSARRSFWGGVWVRGGRR